MSRVFIVGAKRTAIGTFLGSLSQVSAVELGTIAVKAALKQAKVDANDVDEVILGNILSSGIKQGPGRQVLVHAGIPTSKIGYTVNMLCGSGMKSVLLGYQSIKLNMSDVVVSGGMESMSQAPFVVKGIRDGVKMGNQQMLDTLLVDGLIDAFEDYHMGVTAENIAAKHCISRKEQDAFTLSSQEKAASAIANGAFKDEIVPVVYSTRKGEVVFDTDEHPRETSLEILGQLRPAFKADGTVTAGNASGINDGGSAIVLVSEEKVKADNLEPLVEIIGIGQGGVDPDVMGLGPVPAVAMALKDAGLTLEEIDLIELNEAFAAQSLGVVRELSEAHGMSEEAILAKTNVNGGAIALGHPIGASGNRVLVTLIYLMKKHHVKYGLASLCIGGGMGTAVVIKNMEV